MNRPGARLSQANSAGTHHGSPVANSRQQIHEQTVEAVSGRNGKPGRAYCSGWNRTHSDGGTAGSSRGQRS